MCRDRHLAEDVVQETFARAWKSWAELRDVTAAKAWLVTILRHELARSFSRNKVTVDIDALGEADPRPPAERRQLTHIEQLAWRAIRL